MNNLPDWMTEQAYSMLKSGYLLENEEPLDMYKRLANAYKKIALSLCENNQNINILEIEQRSKRLYEYMKNNWLCPATPVCSNFGTERGYGISCYGGTIEDSITAIGQGVHELMMLSKNGGAMGIDFNNIRPRGAPIQNGKNGHSEGVVPFIKIFDSAILAANQGSTRRGAASVSLFWNHGDIHEFLKIRRPQGDVNRQSLNLHHNVFLDDEFFEKLDKGDSKVREIWKEILKTRLETGEPYLSFYNNIQNRRPEWYVKNNHFVKSQNLCQEISLFCDEKHTFVCCLSSVNLARYDEWKNHSLFIGDCIHFLDSVMEDFILKSKDVPGLEKARRFAIYSRALGLGVLGWHTLLQKNNMPFDTSWSVMKLQSEIFSKVERETIEASKQLAIMFGEPELLKGYGLRNSHRCVSGKTKLLTKNGLLNIEDCLEKTIEIWNGHDWTEVKPFHTGKNRQFFRITTSDGSYLDCTNDHLWLIKNNRSKKSVSTETQNLKIGDKLEKWELPEVEGYEDFPYAYTHGFYCGDGSDNQSKPQYKNCKKRKEVRLYNNDKKCITALSLKENCSIRLQKDGSLRFYIPDEMPDKFIVPSINNTIESRFMWLAGLYDADGCRHGTLSSSKKEFLLKIKEMLSYSGIFSSITTQIRKSGFKSESPLYVLHISLSDIQKMIPKGFRTQRICFKHGVCNKKKYVYIKHIEKIENQDSFCLTDPKNGTALFNGIKTKQCTIAPTFSNSRISGGVSEGIQPIVANAQTDKTAKGTFLVKNKQLENVLNQKYNKNIDEVWKSIIINEGSVQHLDFMCSEDKEIFLTAREINQFNIITQASQRQQFLDQGQSINLFFPANVDPKYFHKVHIEASKTLERLYYCRSTSVLKGDVAFRYYDENSCKSCEG